MVKPTGRGRQRIEIQKIQNKVYLGVTLTKRRRGLFKKASDLISLCGIQLAIILFSPDNNRKNNNNRVFSFGHPSVYSILYRYLIHATNYNSQALVHDDHKASEKENESKITNLRAQLSKAEAMIKSEKKTAKDQMVPDLRNDQYNYIETLDLHELSKGLDERLNWESRRRYVEDMNINPNNFNAATCSHGENNVFSPNSRP